MGQKRGNLTLLFVLWALGMGLLACSQPTSGSQDAAGVPDHVELSLTYQAQGDTQWCWATSTSMVVNFFGRNSASVTPAQVVTFVFGSPGKTFGGDPGVVLQALDHWQVAGTSVDTALRFPQIEAEIAAGHPLILFYTSSTVGHAVVLYGYDAPSHRLYLADPAVGEYTVPYSSNLAYDKLGLSMTWTSTVETK